MSKRPERARRFRSTASALRALALFAVLGTGQARADAWDAGQLMRLLAQNPASRAHFAEKKYLRVLNAPLESSGELYFSPPDHLEKRTVAPKPETMVLDRDTLTLERGGRKRSIAIRSYPEVGALIGSIRAALAGDLATLERSFRLELSGTRDRWQLALLPSDPSIAALLANLVLNGRGNRIESIEVMQANGDRSVMTIVPAID